METGTDPSPGGTRTRVLYPVHLVPGDWRSPVRYIVAGDPEALRAAFDNDQPVTVDADDDEFAGDRVHLGYRVTTYADHAVISETFGLVSKSVGQACYAIDSARLGEAPRLAAAVERAQAAAGAAEARLAAQDDACLNGYYE